MAILFGLYFTVIRLFHLYPIPERTRLTTTPINASPSQPRTIIYRIWTIVCAITFVGHTSYLSLLPRFDYTYNMAFNLTLGLTHNALWLLYTLGLGRFPAHRGARPPHAGKAALAVGLTTAAAALELFDFPPWGRAVDAHALWHLSTAAIVPLWYAFLVEDALDDGWRAVKA